MGDRITTGGGVRNIGRREVALSEWSRTREPLQTLEIAAEHANEIRMYRGLKGIEPPTGCTVRVDATLLGRIMSTGKNGTPVGARIIAMMRAHPGCLRFRRDSDIVKAR